MNSFHPQQKKRGSVSLIPKELQEALQEFFPGGPTTDVSRLWKKLTLLSKKFGEEVFSFLLQEVFNLELRSKDAKKIWLQMIQHHQKIRRQTTISLDCRASFLDYLIREVRLFKKPTMVEKEQLFEIHQDTIIDSKTNLYNFRFFQDTLERELQRAQRHSLPFSLIFMDLDHFKNINDRFGHWVGDQTLEKVSEVILETVRSTDIPCRYGGEEFAILVPQTKKDGAFLLAERIRKQVLKIKIPEIQKSILRLSISGGVATFPQDACTSPELLKRADEALYEAKIKGRNRVEVFEGKESENRREVRHPVRLTALISSKTQEPEISSTRNLSQNGISLEVSNPMILSSVIRIDLNLEGLKEPISCIGTITRIHPIKSGKAFEVGVSILKMSKKDHSRYLRFLQIQPAV